MANETILQTRIITKNADWSAWESSTLPLKEGEIVLAKVLTSQTDAKGRVNTVPAFIAKVGEEGKKFSETPWMYAKAVDVYAWAKKENLDVTDIPVFDLNDAAMANVKNALDGLDTRLEVVETNLGQLSTDFTNYQSTVSSTYATKEALKVATDAIEIINGADTQAGSIAKALKDAKDYTDTQVGGEKSRAEGEEAAIRSEFAAADLALSNRVKAIEDDYLVAADKTELDGKITSETNRAQGVESGLDSRLTVAEADIDSLEAKLANVSNVMDFIGSRTVTVVEGVITVTPNEGEAFNSGDVVVDSAGKEYVYDGSAWHEFGYADANAASISDLQTRMTTVEGKVSANESAIATETSERESEISRVEGLITTEAGRADAAEKALDKKIDDEISAREALAGRVATAEGAISTLEGKVSANESAIATNTTNIGTNTSNIAINTQAIADMDAAYKAADLQITNDLAALTQRVTTAEGAIDGVESRVDALEASCIKVGEDNQMYLGDDVIIFNCGGAQ